MAEEDDETTRKLKRKVEELGIGFIDVKTVEEEVELIQLCALPVNLPTKAKLRRLIRAAQQPPVFRVSARVKGALRSHGARGNVYKGLEKYNGFYAESEGTQIEYDGDDLLVKAYFLDQNKAMEFQSFLNSWEIHKTLILLDGVEIDPPNAEPMRRPHDLTRFYLQCYEPRDSESPCETLNQLSSYRLSIPATEPVDQNDDIAIYQSIDVCVGTNKPYKCHLKDKARFKAVARDQNNLLAASWPFHQMLDGLNNVDDMSVVKLLVVGTSEGPIVAQGNRFSVTLRLEFFHQVDADSFQAKTGALRRGTKEWETVVYVRDAARFREYATWKGNDTQSQWDRYNKQLELM